MSGIEEITAKVAELSTVIDAIDVKLDDVKAFIEKLKGSAVTEEQLAELSALVDGVKAQAESVKSEAESLDESAPAPVE